MTRARNLANRASDIVSVKDFGAVGDGVTDDTAAIQAALVYAYSLSTPAANGWRYNTAKVVIPSGKYKIAQANALFATLSAFSGHIIGDGKSGVTELIYSVSSPAATDYMIKDDDLFGFIQFENIKFTCANANGANQNFMLYNGTTLTAQNITFNNCNFYNWTNLVKVGGPVNASENTFYNCHFYNISGVVFDLNNSQAVNWRFYACDAEIITGVLFQYTQGAMVLWSQGSIIPNGSAARVVKIPSGADSNAFGPSNSPNLIFHSARFEMRSGALMADKINSATILNVIFDSCDMGGLNITDPVTYKSFTWVGAGKIEFRSCTNLINHRFNYSVAGTSNHELEIIFDSCTIPRTVLTSSTFTVTGGSTQNIGYLPTIYVKRCGSQLDGEYKPKDSQYMNNVYSNYHGVEKTKHALSFSPEANTMALTSGATFNVYVPSTRVIGVEVFPVANANGAIQGTITVKNAAGTVTLGTATWTMGTPASVKIAVDCNYFVDSLAGDYLTVQFSHNYTPGTVLSFNGQLYLTY